MLSRRASSRFLHIALTLVIGTMPDFLSANVLGLFPVGSDQKSAAMESALESRDATASFYNPALLNNAQQGFQGELGLGRLQYSYEHPRFDPVRLSVVTPVVSAGWMTHVTPDFSLGLGIAPTAMSELKIDGLPRRVDGKIEPLNVQTKRQQLHLALGGAYKLVDQETAETSIGLSIIVTSDQRQLAADSVIDGTKFIDMKSRGLFFRPEVGLTQSYLNFEMGLSYMASLKKDFKGDTILVTANPPSFDTEQVDYDPAVLATSLRGFYDAWQLTVNINRIFGAPGSDVIRDGINRKTTSADLRDVNHLGLKLAYQASARDGFSVGYAYLPTIWGAGSYAKDENGFSSHELGHLFGTFNAMPVRNQAIAWQHAREAFRFHTTLFRTAGTQSVDAGGDNPGFYQMEFISLTTGISQNF